MQLKAWQKVFSFFFFVQFLFSVKSFCFVRYHFRNCSFHCWWLLAKCLKWGIFKCKHTITHSIWNSRSMLLIARTKFGKHHRRHRLFKFRISFTCIIIIMILGQWALGIGHMNCSPFARMVLIELDNHKYNDRTW